MKNLMPDKFFMGKTFRNYTCHTILLAARHKRAHLALTQASKAGTELTYPRGMKG